MKIGENAIDLSGVEIQNLTEQEKSQMKRVREGFAEQAKEVLQQLSKAPELLPVPQMDFQASLKEAQECLQLTEILAWFEKKQAALEETLRWKQSRLKEKMDLLSDVAKPLSTQNRQLASAFADYWDFSAQPAKKATQTRRKQEENEKKPEE